jgi:hypothetical protein
MKIFAYFSLFLAFTVSLQSSELSFPATIEIEGERGCQYYSYQFELKNTGSEVIKIERIEKSCSCTNVEVSKLLLEPGDSASVSGGIKHNGSSLGKTIRYVEFVTDAGVKKKVKIVIDVPRLVRVNPVLLSWTKDNISEEKEFILEVVDSENFTGFELMNGGQVEYDINQTKTNSKRYVFSVKPSSFEAGNSRLIIKLMDKKGNDYKTFVHLRVYSL